MVHEHDCPHDTDAQPIEAVGAMETTADAVLLEVRRLAAAVERLDYAIRGNGIEGLSTKVAKHDVMHNEHRLRIDDHAERVTMIERRVIWFAGVAAAVGALVPTILGQWTR